MQQRSHRPPAAGRCLLFDLARSPPRHLGGERLTHDGHVVASEKHPPNRRRRTRPCAKNSRSIAKFFGSLKVDSNNRIQG